MDNVKSFIKPSFRLRLPGVTAPRLNVPHRYVRHCAVRRIGGMVP